mgnify:CR=1 FL=1
MITVNYRSIDGYSQTRKYKTLAGAQKFAQAWVGKAPDLGGFYAVSYDGVGRITCDGCPIEVLFQRPQAKEPLEQWIIDLIEHWDDTGYKWDDTDIENARKLRSQPREIPAPSTTGEEDPF